MSALLSLPYFWLTTVAGAMLGAVIGSFINMLAYRYPKIVSELMNQLMLTETTHIVPPEHQEFLMNEIMPQRKPYGIAFPGSHCDGCKRPLEWYENIPVISWLMLRGRCRTCGSRIPVRVLLVELICAVYGGLVIWLYGMTLFALSACVFFYLLLALALIDIDSFMLPDELIYMLLWSGLAFSALGQFRQYGVTVEVSIFNAIFMYTLFWMISRLMPGRLGGGDVKLFAAVSVFQTFENAIYLMILASAIGVFWVIGRCAYGGIRSLLRPFPFGPGICLAGLGVFWWQVLF